MKGNAKFVWQAALTFFDSIICSGQLQEQSRKSGNTIHHADLFLNRHKVNIPIRDHVKFQKLILVAESKLHAIFSADFIFLHQGLRDKEYEQN